MILLENKVDGKLTVIFNIVTFHSAVKPGNEEIRRAGRDRPVFCARARRMLGQFAEHVADIRSKMEEERLLFLCRSSNVIIRDEGSR